MRPIPPQLKQVLQEDPYMSKCARSSHECQGKIEWEHSIIIAGRQVNERWAIIPLCTYHHRGNGQNKDLSRHIALGRANDEDLQKFPKSYQWLAQQKQYLQSIFNNN